MGEAGTVVQGVGCYGGDGGGQCLQEGLDLWRGAGVRYLEGRHVEVLEGHEPEI